MFSQTCFIQKKQHHKEYPSSTHLLATLGVGAASNSAVWLHICALIVTKSGAQDKTPQMISYNLLDLIVFMATLLPGSG